MKLIKNLIILGLACSFNSCLMTDYMRTIPVETMKPAVFTIPDSINSIGIFNLSSARRKNMAFEYMENNMIRKDSTSDYNEISNRCTKALADFLEGEKYFAKVRNLGDSLEYLKSEKSVNLAYEKLGIDVSVFLDDIDFKIVCVDQEGTMIANNASLIWSLAYKNDSLAYYYNQNDTLLFEKETDEPVQRNKQKQIKAIAQNSGEYLGKAFGTKLIPTWIKVERMYYQSNNTEMHKAEAYAKNNQWLEAAKIWNKMSTNKNTTMAAKAAYNMALACEMEGHLDPAVEWLIKSYSILKENNKDHQENCQRYINLLAIRKKEIEKLAKQVRN